jgi:lipopolysaccharide/colanic/teichoic acid biosynthesis glycosyltransferase
MEPDTLATPGKPLMESTTWPLEAESAVEPGRPAEIARPAPNGAEHTNGTVANGHSANGHATNGHAAEHLNGHAVNGRAHSANGNGNGHAHLNGYGFAAPALGTTNGIALPAAALEAIWEVHEPRQPGFYLRYGKRAFDIAGALVGLAVAAPAFLVLSALIKLESQGSVLYRSRRIGWRGRAFTFFKLRSMHDGAHHKRQDLLHLNEMDGPVFKLSRDPRVTRIGRWMRTTSLDEIPQFINVLKGEMSLVGPRPPLPEEVGHYEPWQLGRLAVRPGLTCLWQISGRSTIGFQEWMRLDLEYIRHQSFWLDLKILLRTIPAVLSREGAY